MTAPLNLSYVSGRTVTASLYADNVLQVSGIATTDRGQGEYYGSLPCGTPANNYVVVFLDSGQKVASGLLYWNGTQEVTPPTYGTVVLQTAVETNVTVAESLRLSNSVLGSKVSGASTSTETFRDINNTKNRVVSTIDSNGNRTAITLDLT
jgi:hypothetical protein